MPSLIVGLGNPGTQYSKTRHNIGWMALDYFIQNFLKITPNWKKKFNGEYFEVKLGSEIYYFLKPQTFMNLSGESVQTLAAFYKIQNDKILVIYDELDLPFGSLGFRPKGGAGGHNGIKSIIGRLGTEQFNRLRVGIGRPPIQMDTSSYVLGQFSNEENQKLESLFKLCTESIDCYINEGFDKASSRYSKKAII